MTLPDGLDTTTRCGITAMNLDATTGQRGVRPVQVARGLLAWTGKPLEIGRLGVCGPDVEAYAERGLSQASSQVRRSRQGCFA